MKRAKRWAGVGLGLALLALVAAWGHPAGAEAQGPVPLAAGWNNVAYAGEAAPVEVALANAAPVVDVVWHWDAATQAWSWWGAGLPPVSSLTTLEPGEAYWLRASAAVEWSPPAELRFETARVEVVNAAGVASVLRVEIADTAPRRSRGLMFRESLADDAGMLFLFPRLTRGGFWMQNTLVPLSVAFIDEDGIIDEILDMAPLTTTIHTPGLPYRWALEVNQGWFAARGVEAGDVVRLTGE